MSGFGDRHDDDDANSMFASSTEVNSRILFIAIIVLSTVVVVVTMLHVYARYILRRQARRRVAIQDIGLIARIHSEEQARRGLDPGVITSLPLLMYKNIDHGQGVNPECAVCLSSFDDGQMIRVLPNCKHHFHADCIDKWLGSQSSCPICRHEVELGPTIPPLPREPSTRLEGVVGPPSAPPLENTVAITVNKEGTLDEVVQSSSSKGNGSNSRLGSFRRMLSMDRSSRRANSCAQDGTEDLERQ